MTGSRTTGADHLGLTDWLVWKARYAEPFAATYKMQYLLCALQFSFSSFLHFEHL